MIRLTTIVALALGLVATPSFTQEAEACSCFPSTVSSSYQSYDQVVRVRVGKLLKSSDNFTSRYSGNVLEAFKGCLSGSVIIETASNGATCGLGLTRGEWLLNGYLTASKGGTPTIQVNLCGYNREFSSLSNPDLDYLYSRTNCCDGSCQCTDGSAPVNCFAQPCSVSSCDVEGATCQDNYCDGCAAEWYDTLGNQVCNDECAGDEDCSADTWCRQNEAGVLTCVPFVGAGDSCEGFTLPWYYERCEAGLQCVSDPTIADIPGICATCDYNGEPYMEGDSFTADDGCNTCSCGADGAIACTRMLCPDDGGNNGGGKGRGEKCGDSFCKKGDVCCNASCGICTPPGGVCIQLACQ